MSAPTPSEKHYTTERYSVTICDACLDGFEGSCDVPECIFFRMVTPQPESGTWREHLKPWTASEPETDEERWVEIKRHLAAIMERERIDEVLVAGVDELTLKPFRTQFRVHTSVRGHRNAESFDTLEGAKEYLEYARGLRHLDGETWAEWRYVTNWRRLS